MRRVPDDVLLAGAVAVLVAVGAAALRPTVWGVLAGALLCVPLAWRRRRPLGVLGLLGGGVPLFLVVAGPLPVYGLPVLVALYTVAAWGSRERTLAVAAAVVPWVVIIVAVFEPEAEDGGVVAQVLQQISQFAVGLAIGEAVRSQRAYRAAMRDRAERAAREHELETRQRLDEERVRIAQDVHDLVAHSLATISTQASVGVHLARAEPPRAVEALEGIKTVSAQALRELRAALGVLRDPSGGAATAPTPSLQDVPALVQRARDSGLAVELRMEGAPAPLSATLQVAIYRIVQEGLTNVMRHARGARATVAVAFRGTEVEVEVSNDASGRPTESSGSGSGSGLVGMGERAHAMGGRLQAGRAVDGGFRVHALLPTEREPA